MNRPGGIFGVAAICLLVPDSSNGQPWTCTNTGVSHTVIITVSAAPAWHGEPLTAGDYIGVFFSDGGNPVCAGYQIWTGSNIAVAAFGDDALTPAKDGLAAGESFQWKIWRQSLSAEDFAEASYVSPVGIITHGGTYAANGLSQIESLAAPLPVQLVYFRALWSGEGAVELTWQTVSEVNNYGFWVERSDSEEGLYAALPGGFLPGQGTTTVPHSYSFTDHPGPGSWYYRLRQVDLDGSAVYSEAVRVEILTSVAAMGTPLRPLLHPNYPNPFNASTTITYELAKVSNVHIELFDVTGMSVGVLVDETRPEGRHSARFEARHLASGIYRCVMTTEGYRGNRALLLLK